MTQKNLLLIDGVQKDRNTLESSLKNVGPVSYTHLTLPTICSV